MTYRIYKYNRTTGMTVPFPQHTDMKGKIIHRMQQLNAVARTNDHMHYIRFFVKKEI